MLPELPHDLAAFEAELARLSPDGGRISAERVIYEAGAASADRRRGSAILPWSLVAGLLAANLLAWPGLFRLREENRRLTDVVASNDARLRRIESRTESISDAVATLSRPSPSAYSVLRARLIERGELDASALDGESPPPRVDRDGPAFSVGRIPPGDL